MLGTLFLTFAKVGLFTFGGGYAMLPILQRELVENKGWITDEDLTDYYAIGQCTPGVIAVNTATFVGYRLGGIAGACCATLGVIFPSLVIITIIAAFIRNFAHLSVVQHAFAGIRVAVCALVLHTIIKLIRSGVKNVLGVVLLIATFISIAVLELSPIWAVIVAAAAGILSGRKKEGN